MTRRRVTSLPVPARVLGAAALAASLATGLLATTAAAGTSGAAPAGANEQSQPATYVALGDSFSAGTGTRAKTDDCYRSPYGYPVLLAQAHGMALSYQACSGAAIADVRARQVQSLNADTDYVTMTIGGNDLDYAGVLTQCALPGWLSNCQGRINDSLATLRNVMPGRYDALFSDISQRAPAADVVVASYPRLFNGRNCNLATFFTASEMSSLNAATDELADLIEDRSTAVGFGYVDPRAAFTGHAVCDRTEWVNGLSWPIQESYHPNRLGNVGYAEVLRPGTTAVTSLDILPTTEEVPSHADQVRAQADAVLAMDLTSAPNLRAARSEGVFTGELVRLVRQLRSEDTKVVEQALAGLGELDRRHEQADG